jgi:hypothetical protein
VLLFTGVQREFNFTSTPNVLKEVTSPYLSDGEGWEIPAPLNILQMSSVEEDKSFETVVKGDTDNTQSKPANEFFVDEKWGLSVSHEEEITSSHNQEGCNVEVFVVEEPDMKTSTNTHEHELELKVESVDFGSHEPASRASPRTFKAETGSCDLAPEASLTTVKTATAENTNAPVGSLESLLGPTFDVRPVDNGIFSVLTNQQTEPKLSLKELLSDCIYNSNVNVDGEIKGEDETFVLDGVTNSVMNTVTCGKAQVASPAKANTHLMSKVMESDNTSLENAETITTAKIGKRRLGKGNQMENAVPVEILANSLPSVTAELGMLANMSDDMTSVVKPQAAVTQENAPKRNLKLNFGTFLSADEIISTPVVLESLFKQDEPFDLLSYVFDEVSTVTSVSV